MSLYLMYGKYHPGSVEKISSKRTEMAKDLIQQNGGKFHAGYAMLGRADLLFIVDFPDVKDAMKTSIAMSEKFGINFSTNAATTIDEFDKMF